MLLTITAYTLVVGDSLPTLGYLTFLDQFTLISYACIGMIILQLTLINIAEDHDMRNMLGAWCAIGNALALLLMLGSLMAYVHKVITPKEEGKKFDDPCDSREPPMGFTERPTSLAQNPIQRSVQDEADDDDL